MATPPTLSKQTPHYRFQGIALIAWIVGTHYGFLTIVLILYLRFLEVQKFLGFYQQKVVVGASLVCLSFLLRTITVLKSLKYVISFLLVFVVVVCL